MSFDTALILAAIIIIGTVIGVAVFIAHRQRLAREEEMRQEASRRGWTFASLVGRPS